MMPNSDEDHKEFVTILYKSLLGREPDEAGLQSCVKNLATGLFTRQGAIESLVASPEFLARFIAPDRVVRADSDFAEAQDERVLYANGTKQSGPYQTIRLHPEIFGQIAGGYMTAANCRAHDFTCPEYQEFCEAISHPPIVHRKLWEFAFIAHHLRQQNVLETGRRGMGFGVGKEQLPAYFAQQNCHVVATDAPPDVAVEGWTETNQHSSSVNGLFHPDIVDRDTFDRYVSFDFADMNAIDEKFQGMDFCWSSCCFEHLGSIEAGLQFVENTVEKVLKVGGVACHTSELNLSSNKETLDRGATVIFRKQDIDGLIYRLEGRGHICEKLPIEPGSSLIDYLVDVPPFGGDVCLKLRLGQYVSTSFGLVVRRGK